LLAAGFVLAAAPAFAQVQISPDPPMPPPPPGTHEVERTTTTITTIAPVAPPPMEAETPPPPPSAPNLAWKPGHWAWNLDAHNYEWVKGSYVERPAHMVKFSPGYWEHRPDGWMWVDGRWAE
jgi:hypothetical protein